MSGFQEKIDLCFHYDGEIQNGGHLQYFENAALTGFDDHQKVVKALRRFGARAQARILKRAIALRKAETRGSVQSIIEFVERAGEGIYDKLDDKYYDYKRDVVTLLEKALAKHEGEAPVTGDLIAQYVKLSEYTRLHFPKDYSSINVLRNNSAVPRMFKIVDRIEKDHPELKPAFKALLDDADLRGSVAHAMLDNMSYDTEAQRRALDVIEEIAKGDDMKAFGSQLWLRNYYEKNPHMKR